MNHLPPHCYNLTAVKRRLGCGRQCVFMLLKQHGAYDAGDRILNILSKFWVSMSAVCARMMQSHVNFCRQHAKYWAFALSVMHRYAYLCIQVAHHHQMRILSKRVLRLHYTVHSKVPATSHLSNDPTAVSGVLGRHIQSW